MSNLFKKSTAMVAALALVSSIVAPMAQAMDTTDVMAANELAKMGIIQDNSSNTSAYNLGSSITRREMLKIMMNLSSVKVGETCVGKFADMKSTDWGCKYAESALNAWFIAPNKYFRPNDRVTEAEALKMIMQAKGIAKKADVSDWAQAYTQAAIEAGILAAGTTVSSTKAAKRSMVITTAYEAAMNTSSDDTTSEEEDDLGDLLGDLLGDDEDDMMDEDTTSSGSTSTWSTSSTGTTVVTGGDVEIALNPASAQAMSIPSVGTVSFGKFDFTAGTKDTSLASVKLSREGLGTRSDIYRVWMEKNGTRVSGRQTVSSDDSVYITFSPALVVKAWSTETLDLTVSLSGGTNSQHKFTIKSASDVVLNGGNVSGTFPISTATMNTTSYAVVNTAFTVGGSTSTYRAWDKNVELGQFKIQNNASDDKSVTFKSITLRNDGTGDMEKSLSNLALYRNWAKVSTAVSFDGKNITFTLNDSVLFGRQETYYVRGDVDSVELTTWDSYKFTLRYSDDINIVETITWFKSNTTVPTVSTLAQYNVTGGDLILSKSTVTTASQTVAPGTNDVILLDSVLKVAQSITLEDLAVTFNTVWYSWGVAWNLANDFSSLRLVVGNSTVATYTPGSTTTTWFTFEWTFTVSADTTLKILGNIRSQATGKYKLNDVNLTNFARIEYASNGNAVDANQKVGSANWIATTIGSATLTMTRNDGISNQNLTVGSTNQTLLQFSMRANDVSDVTLTKMVFTTGSTTTLSSLANVTNLRLVVDGNTVSTKNMSSWNADFNDINVLVGKNKDVTVKVIADFSTAITTSQIFDLKLSSVEARDVNSITLPSTAINNGWALPTWVVYTFQTAGTATVAINSSTPNSSVLTPSNVETEVARYTLSATDDKLQLTDLYLYNTWTANLASRIKTISLYDVTGTNKLAGGSVVWTGTVQFALGSTSTLFVPKNTSNTVVIVKASFNDITDGLETGKTVQLAVGTLSWVAVVDGTNAWVRLVSESTGNTATGTTVTNSTAKSHLLVRSKPTVAVSWAATLTTHNFTVTADANNRLTLTWVTISLSNPSNTWGTFTLYKDQEVSGNEIGTGTISATWAIAFNYFNSTEISAGTTKTFIFKVSNELTTAVVNSKRILRITDIKFVDMMDTNLSTPETNINSVSSYTNVGLPTTESTFTY